MTMTTVVHAPTTLIQPRTSFLHLDVGALWHYRELLYFLVWRDVRVRYKQTAIGIAWVIIQPLVVVTIFTVIFGRFARLPSDGLPYFLLVFAALVPWTYVSQAITRSGVSLVADANLIRKIYFPRLIIPLAAVTAPIIDLCLSFLLLLGMATWLGFMPSWRLLALPGFLLLGVMTALSLGLWLSALNVRYRDVGIAIPFLTQVWMYASPVAYSISLVPQEWRFIYGLNPVVGVAEGFRWALLGKGGLGLEATGASLLIVMALLVSGAIFFRHMERTFADIV